MNINYSIIIPTFNSHKDLRSLLDSLILITDELARVEIIIIDDGSCDDTRAVYRDFIGRFGNLKYFYQKNRGPAAARNTGAKIACGKYLIFIDDDCLVPKGCLKAIDDFYKQNQDFIGVGLKTINMSKSVFSEYNQRLGDYLIDSSRVSGNEFGYVSSRCYSFTKECYWAMSGHNEGFIWPAAEDRDFCLRIQNAHMKIGYLFSMAVINSDHLRLMGFIKQNFFYGLGAGLLVQKHPQGVSCKFSRFKNMLYSITGSKSHFLQIKLLLAFVLAQICSLAGMIAYKINYDHINRPPSVFPPKHFVIIETLKNFILGIPFVRMIKNYSGSLSTGEELFSAGYLADLAQQTSKIYQEVVIKEFKEANWIKGKRVLEIGPGSHFGVSILFLSQGAQQVVSIDKFGEVKFRSKEAQIGEHILSNLTDDTKDRMFSFLGAISPKRVIGFDTQKPLSYLPDTSIDNSDILEALPAGYFDLIVSFNTLEHITELKAAYRNMNLLLKENGMIIHRVDAGSHYAVFRHCKNRISQFLYSDKVFKLMFSHRTPPTRRILNEYIATGKEDGIDVREFIVDEVADDSEINSSFQFLFNRFKVFSPEEIRKVGFILTARKCKCI